MLKNEFKIRKLLDYKKYHLCTGSHGEWKLFAMKDTPFYLSEKNEPILSSKENTEEELLKFAKKHHCYNLGNAFGIFRIAIILLALILSIINLKFSSATIRTIIYTADFIFLTESIFSYIITEHNFKIEMKELNEKMKKLKNFQIKE